MTYAHSIKFIIELLVLICLYIIAVKQTKQGGRISVLEENQCDCCGWDDSGYTHEPYCATKKEPSFQSKKKAEEQRMNESIPSIHDQLIRKVKKSKQTVK